MKQTSLPTGSFEKQTNEFEFWHTCCNKCFTKKEAWFSTAEISSISKHRFITSKHTFKTRMSFLDKIVNKPNAIT